ncbi:hypothetical protein L0V05_09720 [Tabrizicola sp. J26]|uniref:hypothetical protein n=1 Tax=Alitabrizicola rongguiensis TaxID=2909234 RepID=UPI001F3BE530|nr:hypothetical protein [Tabrizicola rongguiensis]MCF1709093.1 hypothetical protein [Tabrizicola rongguiensis]
MSDADRHPELSRRFGALSRAEAVLVENIGIGHFDRLGSLPVEGDPDRLVRAELIRALLLGGDGLPKMHEKGIRLSGAWIKGILDLEGCRIPHDIGLLDCRFDAPPVLRSAVVDTVSFDGSVLPGLAADRVDARGDILMRSAQISGPIALRGARIGGDFALDGAELTHADDRAVSAERIAIRGGALFRGTRVLGTIALPGAKIGGDLDFVGAHVERHDGPAIEADAVQIGGDLILRRVEVTGRISAVSARIDGDADASGAGLWAPGEIALNLNRSEVDGAFFLRHEAVIDGALSLSGATLGAIVDEAACWPKPGDLLLNRCRYGGFLGAPVGAKERLDWLSRQDPSRWGEDFWPQPYEQLARVLAEMGHQEDKRSVLIAKERLQRQARIRRARRWPRKAVLWMSDRLLWVTTGYGRLPLLALVWILVFWLLGGFYYAWLERTNALRPNSPVVLRSPEWVLCGVPQGQTLFLPSIGQEREGRALPGQAQLACFKEQPEAAAYPKFSALMLSADMIFPGLGSGQKDFWSPDTRITAGYFGKLYAYFQTLAGLGLGLLAVAGFSGIVRSD